MQNPSCSTFKTLDCFAVHYQAFITLDSSELHLIHVVIPSIHNGLLVTRKGKLFQSVAFIIWDPLGRMAISKCLCYADIN